MAQVRFYAMKLDFKIIKKLVEDNPSTSDFAALVFQLEMQDANQWRDEYILIAYPVNGDGKTIGNKIELDTNKNDLFKAKDRLYLGNLPLIRSRIDGYIGADPTGKLIDHLYFQPMQYGDYVSYKIITKSKDDIMALGLDDEFLKPSPPAPPDGL